MNAAIAASPKSAVLYHNRAAYYMTYKDYPKAVADMNKAVQLSSGDPAIVASRAQLFLMTKDYPKALQDLSTVLTAQPADAKFRFTRATVYEALNQYDNAVNDLNLVLKTNPRIGYVYAERGNIFYKQQKTSKAMADFNAALFCNYQDANMLSSMYKEYAKQGRFEAALTPLTRLIALTPDATAKVALYRKRLDLYQKLDKPDQNLIASDLIKIADGEPNNTSVRFQFAESQWQRQPGLALQELDEAIKLEPANEQFISLRGRLQVEHDRYDEAIQDATKAIALNPRSAINFAVRAQAKLAERKYSEAIADASQSASLQPDLAEPYYFKAAAQQALLLNREALNSFGQYLTIKNRDNVHNDEDTARIQEANRRIKFVEGTIAASERANAVRAANEASSAK